MPMNKNTLVPLQERAAQLYATPDVVKDALHQGAREAREIAQQTMQEVRDALGLLNP